MHSLPHPNMFVRYSGLRQYRWIFCVRTLSRTRANKVQTHANANHSRCWRSCSEFPSHKHHWLCEVHYAAMDHGRHKIRLCGKEGLEATHRPAERTPATFVAFSKYTPSVNSPSGRQRQTCDHGPDNIGVQL